MDFMKELARRMKIIAEKEQTGILDEPKKVEQKLFNIHKRSLPVGIDKPVLFGLTRDEADLWEKRLKPRSFYDGVLDYKTLIYWEVIPQNASPKERSIYFNTPETRRIKQLSED